MKLRGLAVVGSVVAFAPASVLAGGLFLPGSGAISTSRAGAAVASTEDGEALSVNPAGLAKTRGTTITISAAIISYAMEFTRRGTYDLLPDQDRAYEGQPYATVKNDPDLALGIGSFQPVPVIAVASDLGGAVPGLRVAAGLYAPNAYPFRDMTGGYEFNADFDAPPPPTRYDIMEQEAAMAFPSLAASYRVLPELDLGMRLSWGIAELKSTVAVWGLGSNYEEDVLRDAAVTVDATDTFVPTFGIGALYRPTPTLELGFNFNFSSAVHATGTATAQKGPNVQVAMQATEIGPVSEGTARCAAGGTFEEQKACIDLQLPMNAQLGARYKFLDAAGELRGDIELDVGWEDWGKRCEFRDFADGCVSPGQYRVVIDAAAYTDTNGNGDFTDETNNVPLKESVLDHRFNDTYSLRLGGSYHLPMGANRVILRGGVGYDTRAAEDGWLRADIDGAGRTTATIGASYRAPSFEISIGGGAIFEGEQSNDGDCNPTPVPGGDPQPGCGAGGAKQSLDDRRGPDPVDPLVVPASQLESPITQGTYTSSYTLLMLGFSTWF